MIPVFRLDSASPMLADGFRQASLEKRRRAVRVACELAASSAGLTEPEVATALETLRLDKYRTVALRAQLKSLVTRFDDCYLRLWEQADEAADESKKFEAQMLFSKARAVSALVFAISDESAHLHDAIYEALLAMNEPDEFVGVVMAALR